MSPSSGLEPAFHIRDYFRENPQFANLLLVAPAIVEIGLDSAAEVVPPGQAPLQEVRRLLIPIKTIILISLSKFRLNGPFLIFALVCCKSVPTKVFSKLATIYYFSALGGG